jgi:SpoIID/LytB domain protein
MSGAASARVTLSGKFAFDGGRAPEGDYLAMAANGAVRLEGPICIESAQISLAPEDFYNCSFTIHEIVIGKGFHWEQSQAQSFRGKLSMARDADGLLIINEIPLESYLVSVISSEMSASSPAELLRAHSIVARSWLLAQLMKDKGEPPAQISTHSDQIIRWYDRAGHARFDVCNDDHCQRYHGISGAFSPAAFQAVADTRGQALTFGSEICDARYSKCCGGMTELYRAAWEDRHLPYLKSIYDWGGKLLSYALPLSHEANAERWINSEPPAYCNLAPAELISRILPSFDQQTRDFYRWHISYGADELSLIVRERSGIDFGRILSLEPMERGLSGRIIKLRVVGQKRTAIIGKELEIRRALGRSHLYSSAFVVRAEADRFHLSGAGWGHGVGMCQIGAAVMAWLGHSHRQILSHYFPGTSISKLY